MNESAPRDMLGREETIFNAAVQLSDPAKRAIYLNLACEGDPGLRARIEGLLASDAGDDLFAQPLLRPVLPSSADATTPLKPAAKEADARPRAERIGGYKLLEKIGEGGCGVVYVAEQEEPVRRKVALKVIKLGMDTRSVVARFEAERQALALMDHPNIAKVLEAGATETGRPYFVMELVRGLRITDFCDQNHFSTRERLDLFIQVCRAVQHAHQKGIIHRDLKPSNILVTVNDGVAVPKVIDFGIAKATEGRLTDKTVYTELHHFIGTPAYMSPEQAELTSVDIDTRSDIYSLGVLLYELLTGGTPFDQREMLKAGLDAMRQTILAKEPPRPSTRLSALGAAGLAGVAHARRSEPPKLIHLVRGDLDWIVMKCLEKDRARRYETANGLAMDLKRHLDNEPVVARPPSGVYRLQKAWRRNKLAFTAAAAVAAALVIGTTVSTWQAVETSRARNAEKRQRLTAQTEGDKAKAAQQAENEARLRADTEKAEARHLLYVADMNLAQQAWDQNNVGQLRQLLADTQDSPYRGFEWFYWQAQPHLALKTLRGHLDGVRSVAFSPDGQRIATGSQDGTAKVWDAVSGRELVTLKGYHGQVGCVALSPDGQRILAAGGDTTAKVWDLATGKGLLTLRGHSRYLWSAAFSADGQRIVTSSADHTAKVWEASDGRELFTLKGHTGEVTSATFSPDCQWIVTGSWDETARVWDAASGRQVRLLKASDRIFSLALSPDGRRLVIGSHGGIVTVWDAAGGKELFPLKGHSDNVTSVDFSPDGQRILTGSFDQTAKVWDAATGQELVMFKGHSAQIYGAAFSPDGQQVVTGSGDETAKVWDAESGPPTGKTSRSVVTLQGHGSLIYSMAISPDGQRIVTGGIDGAIIVREGATGRELRRLNAHSGIVVRTVFSPDGHRILTGSQDHTAKVWDAATYRELVTLKGHLESIGSVAMSPDGKRIVTGCADGTLKVWDAASGRELQPLKAQSLEIGFVAYSRDGRWVLTGSWDKSAKLWDTTSSREAFTLEEPASQCMCGTFSLDGRRIVIGCYDGTAKVWDAASGRKLVTLRGHSGVIGAVTFSPDGQRILTGSWDKTARLWEATSGRELLSFRGHGDRVVAVSFSADGQRILTGSIDKTVRVWDAARPEQVAAWQEQETAAAQALAAGERKRKAEQEIQAIVRARESIKQWLILAPIALAPGQSGAEGLDCDQIQDEGRVRPKAGEAISVAGGELKWRDVALTNEVIDFNALLGRDTDRSVAYAVCYLRSDTDQSGLQMLVGSDDESKVYLNGKQIYKCLDGRPLVPDEDTVPDITLNAGLNVLVFKVVNETIQWQGSVRFIDAAGQPVKGIRVTLTPP